MRRTLAEWRQIKESTSLLTEFCPTYLPIAIDEIEGLVDLVRRLGHPDERDCPICGAVFDTHCEHCPVEELLGRDA
jgi:hypothetical protein